MKKIGIGLVCVIGLALVACAVTAKNGVHGEFDAGQALGRGETYNVRIVRDAYGVPHIFGERDEDAAFGFGYAQSKDNIENIQTSIFFTRGQLGLQTGREGAKTDYLMAAMRVKEAFDEKYESDLSPEVRAVAEAYADGINFFCAEQKGRCKNGFAPVTGKDVAAAGGSRGPFVYGLDRVLAKLFGGGGDAAVNGTRQGSNLLQSIEQDYANLLGVSNAVVGSNAIAVAPSRSPDGHTRFFSNAHQPFVGLATLYEARIKSGEGWDVYGAFIAGSPLAIFGANENLAWTITVSKPDLIDIYEMEVDDPKNPSQYKMDGEWRDFEISTARLGVKLWGPVKTTVKRKVYHSVHGPVLETPDGWYALAFAGYENVQSLEQSFRTNKASTQEEWLEAVRIQAAPAFNIVYADKEGNIAYYYNARSPIRSPDWDWSEIAPGNRSDLLWQGTHPFGTVMPIVQNPQSGFVVSANHDPFHVTGGDDNPKPEDYPQHLGVVAEESNRGLRIHDLFDSDPSISRQDILEYKMDSYYAEDSYMMTLLRDIQSNPAIAGNPEFAEALALFKSWDGNTEIETRAAGLATRFGQLVYGIEINPTKADPIVSDPVEALRQAIAEYKEGFGRIDPEWGEVNRLRRGDVDLPLRGGPDILRAIYSIDNPKDGPTAAIAGDSLMFFVDWDPQGVMRIDSSYHFGANKVDKSSPHYADQAPMFAAEDYRQPPMTLEAVLNEATADYKPGARRERF